MHGGMEEKIKLSAIFNVTNLDKKQTLLGIWPDRKFPSKERICKVVKKPTEVGKLPNIQKLSKVKDNRLDPSHSIPLQEQGLVAGTVPFSKHSHSGKFKPILVAVIQSHMLVFCRPNLLDVSEENNHIRTYVMKSHRVPSDILAQNQLYDPK